VPSAAAEPSPGEGNVLGSVAKPEPPQSVVDRFLSVAASEVGRVVRPEAAAAVATEFGFPLALTLAVVVFLVVQNRLDARDPKLRAAPQTYTETVVQFQSEDQL
jgi:hypothetical protein